MYGSLTRFSWMLFGGKEKDPVHTGSSLNSSADWSFGLREPDPVKFRTKNLASRRKVKRKWQSGKEKTDCNECGGDVSLVPSDGGVCLSGSESDGPDWSIGWVEPHGPDFRNDDETEDGFAVLVPCYRLGCRELVKGSNNRLLSAIKNLPSEFASGYAEGKNYTEWFSSLQNF